MLSYESFIGKIRSGIMERPGTGYGDMVRRMEGWVCGTF